MSCIAIIPARSGSKGLKDKNILDLGGKPLLAWTIEAAKSSGCFDEVIVSSDSREYLDIAERYGARGHLRPEALAGDDIPTFPVIRDLLCALAENPGREEMNCPCGAGTSLPGMPDEFALLQPTSPLRTARHIREAYKLFDARREQYDFLASVCPAHTPSILVRPIEEDGSMKHFDEDYSQYRRQDFPEYSPNGAIYLAKTNAYLTRKHFYGSRSLAYIMDPESSIDIDGPMDLALARLCMTAEQDPAAPEQAGPAHEISGQAGPNRRASEQAGPAHVISGQAGPAEVKTDRPASADKEDAHEL